MSCAVLGLDAPLGLPAVSHSRAALAPMSPPWFSCVLLLLLACAAGPRASLAQITDVVVVEPFETSTEEGAPAPALIATVDAQGNVQQRIISPQDVEAVRLGPGHLWSLACARLVACTGLRR